MDPPARVAAKARYRLDRAHRQVGLGIDSLERHFADIITTADELRGSVDALAGDASPELIGEMARHLRAVRWAADAVGVHVRSKLRNKPDEYLMALISLAENLEEKIDAAAHYFGEVEGGPSTLRSVSG
ncbi:hypothetical protein [Dactylosporangium sp. NPDC051541]|uniref:hypothetical protein n=1 Tax=Dactylosporangium sp. NPDC051541 TaxID=3363977 RepID=UPI00378F6C97